MNDFILTRIKLPKIVVFLSLFILIPAFSGYAFPQVNERGIQVDPFYEKLFEDGKYFFQEGNYAEAIKNLEVAFFGFLDNPEKLLECYLYLEVCYFQTRDYEKSKYYSNEIKRLKLEPLLRDINLPDNVLDKYHEIAAYFARFEPKASDSTSSATSSTAGGARTPSSLSLSSQMDLEEEIKQLKEFVNNNRKNSEAYFKLSSIYFEQRKYYEAKAVLKDLIKVDPKNGNAYFELGRICVAEKKPKEALASFEKAASFLADDIEVHYELGKMYFNLKNYEKAKQEFVRVQEITKNYKDAEEYMALLKAVEEEKNKASQNYISQARQEMDLAKKIKLYKQALASDPSNIDIYFEMKSVYLAEKKYKDATKLLELLLKYYADNIRIYIELGDVYLNEKSYARAVNVLEQGKVLDEENVELRYLLGKAYMGLRKYNKAADEFDIVLSSYPYYKDARDLRRSCLLRIKK